MAQGYVGQAPSLWVRGPDTCRRHSSLRICVYRAAVGQQFASEATARSLKGLSDIIGWHDSACMCQIAGKGDQQFVGPLRRQERQTDG